MRPTYFALLGSLLFTATSRSGPIDYLADIKPLFAKHCTRCHGPQKQSSGLRLDTAVFALQGGNSGAVIVPGKSADSRLIKALLADKGAPSMPLGGGKLHSKQITVIAAWIDQGAKAPANEKAEAAARPSHWSFQPVKRPVEPAVKNEKWIHNPIDRFILARLEKDGIAPSSEADRVTLIRRLYLDMVGLPPLPANVDSFLKDDKPGAYERVVDKLLASPHYGERWGRHWLDLARYADSNGYSIDAARSIWPYRDWVIKAMNGDMPFDQFVIEQMAGDLLPNATPEQNVATGFHRNTPINQEGGIDVEMFRVESIVDRVNTTGAAFLGLTVGCAQCHDHKYDPLTQREYYQLFAFLNQDDEPTFELGKPDEVALKKKVTKERTALEKQFKALDKHNEASVLAWQGKLTPEMRADLPMEIDHIVGIAPNGRDEKQQDTILTYVRNLEKTRHAVGGLLQTIPFASLAHLNVLQTRNRLEVRLAALKRQEPNVPTSLVLRKRPTPRTTNVHLGGDFIRKGVKVDSRTPEWMPSVLGGSRLDLARWLVLPENPLTARVAVNRIWQGHFGLGIVETENDFGTQGVPPSHPDLLDWLASEFIRLKWSQKDLHKLIVCSATYRQSSKSRPELALKDPRNRLMARMPRLRLEAEVVRDVALAASGLLNPKIGGPSVFPPQPDGVFVFTQVPRVWTAASGPDRFRRGMYTWFWRSAPHPGLTAFDAPDATMVCTRRNRSNTPLQALTLLNDEASYEFAAALANRVRAESNGDTDTLLSYLFRLCLSRAPQPAELAQLQRLHQQVLREIKDNSAEAKIIVAKSPKALAATGENAALVLLARAVMNVDEFITRE
jgi:mono/diheme cytochrome c family protein